MHGLYIELYLHKPFQLIHINCVISAHVQQLMEVADHSATLSLCSVAGYFAVDMRLIVMIMEHNR